MTQATVYEAASAVVFSTTQTGEVLLTGARYYETTTAHAWEYVHDVGLIAADMAPDFAPPGGYDLSAELAATAHSNAVAAALGQLLAVDAEGASAILGSLVDFGEQHGTLAGLESVFFSAALTELHSRAGDLIGRAESVLEHVGGLSSALAGDGDLLPVIDGITAEFGFPSLATLREIVSGDLLEDPTGGLKAPGHRVFDRVQRVLGTVDSDLGSGFEQFRHSDVGHFVETVASIALGIGLLLEAPLAVGIKAGSALVEGVVGFIAAIFHAVFDPPTDSSQEPPPDEPDDGPDPAHKDEIRKGKHAVVGCWVDDPELVFDEPVEITVDDGSCPDPDLTTPVPVPDPDEPGAWPSPPEPWLGGPGIGGLLRLEGPDEVRLAMPFAESGALDVVGLVPDLGWDEASYEALVAHLDELQLTLPGVEWALGTRTVDLGERGGGRDHGEARLRASLVGGKDHLTVLIGPPTERTAGDGSDAHGPNGRTVDSVVAMLAEINHLVQEVRA